MDGIVPLFLTFTCVPSALTYYGSVHSRMYEHIQELEKRPGASFRAIFNRALELGTLSRRRVYYEVMKCERERGGGLISPFGLSTFTASAALQDVKSIEVIIRTELL